MADVLNLDAERNLVARMVLATGDINVIEQVKEILLKASPEGRISIQQYNDEIDEAVRDVKNGNYITHEEVIALTKEWKKRK